MDNSLLAVRGINHKYIVVERENTGETEGQEDTEENNTEIPGEQTDTGEDGTEEPDGGEDAGGDDTEETEDKENNGENDDLGTDGTEDENPPEDGDTEQGEPETGQDGENTGEDTGQADVETEEPEEAEDEPVETISENTVQAEDAGEEAIMLLSEDGDAAQEYETDSTYTDENGVIYHYYGYGDGTAEIYELESYKESTWDYKALDIPAHIGAYDVTRLTFTIASDVPKFPSVTIPETVTYMEGSLFKFMFIRELYYNAEAAETGASSESTGVFFRADIRGLHIGENVKVIPDYCFDSAKMTFDELVVNAERIGKKAFYYDKEITTLTIGEDVKVIGVQAFANNQIENIHYNAVNAESGEYSIAATGTFYRVSPSSIDIGDKVAVIPDVLFGGINYTADALAFPECLTAIGKGAFYGSGISIGELTIGENITSIGQQVFTMAEIGTLHYNAVDARLDGEAADKYYNPFERTHIGELLIGEHVRSLPDGLFYKSQMLLDSLALPESLTYIGSYVLSYNSGKILNGTLEIGENVTHIGRGAFGVDPFDRVVVRTTRSDSPVEDDAQYELPQCAEVEIHRGSPYYNYFTKGKSDCQVTLLCEDFETTRGAEYYDAAKKAFVTPITDTCTVCGYAEKSAEYGEACTVIFADYDGSELSRQHIHKGEDAEAPEDPERAGYRFTGWDKAFTNVSADLTVCAEYEIKKFSVVFKDGDRTISEQEVSYGGSAEAPEEPARPEEEWGRWAFTGWSGSYTNVEKDETVLAQFKKVLNQYEVTFYDAEGNVISRQTVAHGEAAEAPDAPEKEPTAQHSYVFTGWSQPTEGITGDTACYPVYDTNIRSYTVTFMDGSTVLDTQTVAYGEDAEAPADPSRPEEEWGRWEFTGWGGSYTHITKDEVVRAQFNRTVNEYEVVFYDAEGNVISRQTVAHGEAAEELNAPEKEPTAQYRYLFTGWSAATEKITGDTACYPAYDTQAQTYTVTFMDGSAVLDVQEVAYGGDAKLPENPARPEEEWGRWEFTGWSGSYTSITKDEVVRAGFEKIINQYEVTFCDTDGKVISRQTVSYGEDAVPPADPARPEEEWGRWEFTGWDGSYTHVTKDETVRAQFREVRKQYEVIFYDAEGNVISRQTVDHGMKAKEPEAPARKPTDQKCYVFAGWDGDTKNITKESRFHPLYETKTRMYTVAFMNGSTTYDVQEVAYGSAAETPPAPTKKADKNYTYKFTGWDKDYSFITADLTVYAVFEKTQKPKKEETGHGEPEEDGGETGKPEDGSPDVEKPEDGGQEPDAGAGGEPAEDSVEGKPGLMLKLPAGLKIALHWPKPQADQEKEAVFPVPEIPAEPVQPEEKTVQAEDGEGQEIQEAVQETEESKEKTVGEAERQSMPTWIWLLLLGAGAGALGILFWLFGNRERIVCGTILNGDGSAIEGIKVSLAGQETENAEVQTDEDGQYMFGGLEKDDYRLCITGGDGVVLLLDICMKGRRGKKAFAILKSNAASVETKQDGKRYRADVTL